MLLQLETSCCKVCNLLDFMRCVYYCFCSEFVAQNEVLCEKSTCTSRLVFLHSSYIKDTVMYGMDICILSAYLYSVCCWYFVVNKQCIKLKDKFV